MSKKTKTKKPTLRHRLKAQASEQLDYLVTQCQALAAKLGSENGVPAVYLLRLAGGGRTDSVQAKAVNAMANKKEADLEKLWNDQQILPLEDSSDGE